MTEVKSVSVRQDLKRRNEGFMGMLARLFCFFDEHKPMKYGLRITSTAKFLIVRKCPRCGLIEVYHPEGGWSKDALHYEGYSELWNTNMFSPLGQFKLSGSPGEFAFYPIYDEDRRFIGDLVITNDGTFKLSHVTK